MSMSNPPLKVHRTIALTAIGTAVWMSAMAPVLLLPAKPARLLSSALLAAVLVLLWRRRVPRLLIRRTPALLHGISLAGLAALCYTALCVVLRCWVNIEPVQFGLLDESSLSDLVALALLTLVSAPLAEELIFRGFMLRRLRTAMGDPAAIAICAVSFGVAHARLSALPALIAAGVLLTMLMVRTGNLWLAALAHSGFNAGVWIEAALGPSNGNTMSAWYPMTAALVAACAATGFWRLQRSTSDAVVVAPTPVSISS